MTLKQWLGQTTTGAGFATVLAGAGSLATGTIGWQQALPLLMAGIAGLIWPENSALQAAAKQTAADAEAVIAAYQTGVKRAAPASATAQPVAPK